MSGLSQELIGTSPVRRRVDVIVGALVAVVSVMTAVHVLGFDVAGLKIPTAYAGDGLFYQMLIKSILEHGSAYFNPDLGAPFGLDYRPFPMPEPTHFAVLKAIGLATSDSGTGYNVFLLVTFAAAAASAYAAMRQLGIAPLLAATGAFLYAIQSFHFQRQAHLFLASYWSIPVFAMIAFRIADGRRALLLSARSHLFRIAASLVVLVAAVGSGSYYCLFGCVMIATAALVRVGQTGDTRALARATGYLLAIACLFLLMMSPSLHYALSHAPSDAWTRIPSESETLGLKVVQLLLPWQGHRLDVLRQMAESYRLQAPLVNENGTAAIGVIASSGMLLAVFTALFVRARRDTTKIALLGCLILVAILYSTIGGVGTIFAWLVSPSFRGLNRVSIEIAFLALCAIMLGIQLLVFRLRLSGQPAAIIATCLVLGAIGYIDQTPNPARAAAVAFKARYEADQAFGATLTRLVGEHGRVYQLPYQAFPEAPAVKGIGTYAFAIPYLHSHGVSFSYGAMRYTPADEWLRSLEPIDLAHRLPVLGASGFTAVLVLRRAFPDDGKATESTIEASLGAPFATCPDSSCALYRLAPSPAATTSQTHLWATPGNGWKFRAPKGTLLPAVATSLDTRIYLMNPLATPTSATIAVSLKSASDRVATFVDNRSTSTSMTLRAGQAETIKQSIEVAPGINEVYLRFDPPPSRRAEGAPDVTSIELLDLALVGEDG